MRVRWTTDAADDLERISDYIADDRPETPVATGNDDHAGNDHTR